MSDVAQSTGVFQLEKEAVKPEVSNEIAKDLEQAVSHTRLVNVVGKHYADQNDGYCLGFSLMGIQAILSGHLDQFDKRLEKLGVLTRECGIPSGPLPDEEAKKIRDKILESKDWDLLAFLEGVQICQRGHIYKDLLDLEVQDIRFRTTALSLIASKDLEKQGGGIALSDFSTTGSYTQDQLEMYFSSLRQNLLGSPPLTSPVTCSCGTVEHAIAFGYDPKKGWIFIDANKGFSQRGLSDQEIAEAVYNGLQTYKTRVEKIVMAGRFIVLKNSDTENLKSKLQKWQASAEFIKTHQVPNDSQEASDILCLACLQGDNKTVEKMIQAKVDLNALDRYQTSPIGNALMAHNAPAIAMLEQAGVTSDSYGASVLGAAIKQGALDIVQVLLKAGADPNAMDKNGDSALTFAIWKNNPDIVRALIQGGAKIDRIDANGNSALRQAINYGTLDIVQLLLRAGADPNAVNDEGVSVLKFAVWKKDPDIVRALVQAGANINAVNTRGISILRTAKWTENAEIVQILKDAGAKE